MRYLNVNSENKPRKFKAEDVRQGEIILRTKAQRWIFIGGFIGVCVVAVVVYAVWLI